MFSFAKALTLGTLVCLTLPVACGDDDDNGSTMTPSGGSDAGGEPNGTPTPEGGSGGAGTSGSMLPPGLSSMPSSTMCGGEACDSAKVGGAVNVDPCCDSAGACGLNTGFLSLVGAKFPEVCQAHNQPGEPSTTCGAASGLVVPFPTPTGATLMVTLDPFPGCCRPDGTCGVVIDQVTASGAKLADFGLGCVDAAPFSGGVVKKCAADTGMGGAGGMSAGGEAGVYAGGAGGAGGAGR